MTTKVTIPVEVEVQAKKGVEGSLDAEYEFVSMKIGDGQPIPLPQDKPAPRRLVKDFAEAARKTLRGEPLKAADADKDKEKNASGPTTDNTTTEVR